GLLGTLPGLVLGHTVLGVPYVVLVMSVAIKSFDVRIEQVTLSLGASWFTMFRRVLLPNLMPSAFAAWIFAFITSFDEVIVTLFVGGAYNTIPKRMFNELVLQINPTITAIATLLIAFSLVLLVLFALMMRRAGLIGRPPGGGDRPRRSAPLQRQAVARVKVSQPHGVQILVGDHVDRDRPIGGERQGAAYPDEVLQRLQPRGNDRVPSGVEALADGAEFGGEGFAQPGRRHAVVLGQGG